MMRIFLNGAQPSICTDPPLIGSPSFQALIAELVDLLEKEVDPERWQ
jgi:hypothetical protein